ncbi:hypothetical protein CSQ87_07370 [Bifidobacterium simiarum]|uniref:Bacterial EndoU nuclease domain-containing protein n=2 Tax=Bifidobacterium simiarum TaxID=2045441 RepID=A0A2M9HDZ1_9BIFI|nr:hypothetical protein CSQ87_07370 [Bifidobacterium simiarum]
MLLDYLPALVGRYGGMAAAAAADWYEATRGEYVPGSYDAVLADAFPDDAVRASVKWRAGALFEGDEAGMYRFAADAMDRWIRYSSRSTVLGNIRCDPARPRWARVPQGVFTCSFCEMLASRGFDYTSKQTAGSAGRRFHNDCDCQIVPEWDAKGGKRARDAYLSGYDPDAMRERVVEAADAIREGRLEERWRKDARRSGVALDPSSPSGDAVAFVMRRQHPDLYVDGVYPDDNKQTRGSGPRGIGSVSYAKWRSQRKRFMSRFAAEKPDHGRIPPDTPLEAPRDWPDDLPLLTSARWNHIIYGEYKKRERGSPYQSGHMHGYGWWDASKSTEFPVEWTPDDILDSIKGVLQTTQYGPNSMITGIYQGISVKVIIRDSKIATAYPVHA